MPRPLLTDPDMQHQVRRPSQAVASGLGAAHPASWRSGKIALSCVHLLVPAEKIYVQPAKSLRSAFR